MIIDHCYPQHQFNHRHLNHITMSLNVPDLALRKYAHNKGDHDGEVHNHPNQSNISSPILSADSALKIGPLVSKTNKNLHSKKAL